MKTHLKVQTLRPSQWSVHVRALGMLCLSPLWALATQCDDSQTAGKTNIRYEIRGDQVLDRQTNLVWQRCSVGQRFAQGLCLGVAKSMGLIEAQQTAKRLSQGWRVPTLQELDALLKKTCKPPYIDQVVFPSVQEIAEGKAKYWSTSRDKTLPELRYNIDFLSGEIDANTVGIALGVRLVRKNSDVAGAVESAR